MCVVPASLTELREKGVEEHILQRDLGGYWDHVYTVHPFTDHNESIQLNNQHTVIEMKCGKSASNITGILRVIHNTVQLAGQLRVSAVKAHDPYACGVLAYIISRVYRIPYVVGVYSSYEMAGNMSGKATLCHRWVDQLVSRFLFRKADMVFGGSGDATRFALQNGARDDRTSTVRTGGVAEVHFAPLQSRQSTRQRMRRELGWDDTRVLLFVGRFHEIKFPQDAINAFEVVSGRAENVRLVMLGDGDMRSHLVELAKSSGLDIDFPGFVSQEKLAGMLSSADVILAPLSGSSLVEAALSGTPIVAYDVDWHEELIVDGKTGVLVPFRDWEAMGRATVELLNDTNRGRMIGRQARQAALDQHSLDVLYEIESACFDQVFERRRRHT